MACSCNWINQKLLVGGLIEFEGDLSWLKKSCGITHIVNYMREDRERGWCVKYNVAYLHNGLPDDGQPKPVAWFKTTLDWVLPFLVHPGNKIYLHCRGGSNRGPSHAYIVLRALGFAAEVAESMIRSVRPDIGLAYKKDGEQALVELGWK